MFFIKVCVIFPIWICMCQVFPDVVVMVLFLTLYFCTLCSSYRAVTCWSETFGKLPHRRWLGCIQHVFSLFSTYRWLMGFTQIMRHANHLFNVSLLTCASMLVLEINRPQCVIENTLFHLHHGLAALWNPLHATLLHPKRHVTLIEFNRP